MRRVVGSPQEDGTTFRARCNMVQIRAGQTSEVSKVLSPTISEPV